jgi:SAM-dependent methyltransferase
MSSPVFDADKWRNTSNDYVNVFEPFTSLFANVALTRLALTPTDAVLDVACGPGAAALAAAQVAASVDAIDFSAGMVDLLAARIASTGAANVRAQRMDGQALTFADGSFDAALSSFGVFLFPDWAKGLREMLRVLKTGGRAAVLGWAPPPKTAMAPLLNVLRRECGAEDILRPGGWVRMETAEGMRGEMESAGFKDVRVEALTFPVVCPQPERFYGASASNPFVEQLLKHHAPGREQEMLDKTLKEVADVFGCVVPAEALLAVGWK